MAAAGVGPEARGVVFGEGALLQQQFAFRVKDEDGKGSMQMWRDMRGLFLHLTNRLVVLID
jgi:hypothetical protein